MSEESLQRFGVGNGAPEPRMRPPHPYDDAIADALAEEPHRVWRWIAFLGLPLGVSAALYFYFLWIEPSGTVLSVALGGIVSATALGIVCLRKTRAAWWALALYAAIYMPLVVVSSLLSFAFGIIPFNPHWS